jgi:hypothetical protein
MNIRFFPFLLALMFLSCHKDIDITPSEGTCIDNLPERNSFGEYTAGVKHTRNEMEGFGYYDVTNPDFIFYMCINNKTSKQHLYRMNRRTKCKDLIRKNIGAIHENTPSGWIALTTPENFLAKMRTNGNDFQQLTDFPCWGFTWNTHTDVIAMEIYDNSVILGIKDKLFALLYPLPSNVDHIEWSPDGMKLGMRLDTVIGYYDMQTQEYVILESSRLSFGNRGRIPSFCTWTPDSKHMIWVDAEGLFKTNIETQETIKIREICPSRSYWVTDVSPDGTKLLAGRVDAKPYKVTGIEVTSYMVEMNIDGSNERKVEF